MEREIYLQGNSKFLFPLQPSGICLLLVSFDLWHWCLEFTWFIPAPVKWDVRARLGLREEIPRHSFFPLLLQTLHFFIYGQSSQTGETIQMIYIYTSIKKSGDIKSMESSGWYNWNIQLFCSSQSCFWKPIFRGKACWCKSLDDCCKSLLCKSQIEDRPRKVKWQIISFCCLAPKLGFAGSRTLSINTTFVKASTLKVQHNIFLQIRERTILLDRNQMIKYEKAQL